MDNKFKDVRPPVRLGTKVSADTNEWLDKKAYELGFTKSALINMAVENYREKIDAVGSMPEIVKELKRLSTPVE